MRRAAVLVVLLLTACASVPSADSSPLRATAEGGDVRVEATIAAQSRLGEPIAIEYVITNERPAPISVADAAPETTFDAATHTATVKVGATSAASGAAVVRLAPGEKRSFRTVARLAGLVPSLSADPAAPNRTMLRLQVNFLDDGRPESVYTNAVPAYR
jgi:hypothetical protein